MLHPSELLLCDVDIYVTVDWFTIRVHNCLLELFGFACLSTCKLMSIGLLLRNSIELVLCEHEAASLIRHDRFLHCIHGFTKERQLYLLGLVVDLELEVTAWFIAFGTVDWNFTRAAFRTSLLTSSDLDLAYISFKVCFDELTLGGSSAFKGVVLAFAFTGFSGCYFEIFAPSFFGRVGDFVADFCADCFPDSLCELSAFGRVGDRVGDVFFRSYFPICQINIYK